MRFNKRAILLNVNGGVLFNLNFTVQALLVIARENEFLEMFLIKKKNLSTLCVCL